MDKDNSPTKNTDTLINPVTCEACGLVYDYYLEPAEVKEGGIHICPECWENEDTTK